ncbi:MAG: hypothetical protein JKY30_10075 [Flavobacteriales bacterium]|nr:hypothetical protein [Flavobacteriales bacterium]
MTKSIIKFAILLVLLLGIVSGIHIAVLDFLSLPLFENKIIDSYFVNFFLTIFIFVGLMKFKDKFAESLGYIFFIGSFIKFIVFFILIYPSFNENGDVSKLEFTSFFISYAFSLFFEVLSSIKILNKQS